MKLMTSLSRLLSRFVHPVSLPEDVAAALGIQLSNFLSESELLQQLKSATAQPCRLSRFMSREAAEAAFQTALKKERFTHHSLYSYNFGGNWLEFVLQFDEQRRLRRVYLHHKDIPAHQGLEITLRRQ